MLNKLAKRIIRKMAWTAKKKTIMQVLKPRRRRDGMPEYGRFISRDIEQEIFQAHLSINELTPYFSDFDSLLLSHNWFFHRDGKYRWSHDELKVFSDENGAVGD